ncbi:hypothetical protein AAFF_G00149050 [Aldrovandia affinis]|uniref:Protein kinase domain-containing protein n=1 Tax=Aldrovandia affinis TaxID=143900 RepID=A0AAD7W910_9TELE|nr:hypothetical protein AAFF_G00149050 [Aldrovandia affinis]
MSEAERHFYSVQVGDSVFTALSLCNRIGPCACAARMDNTRLRPCYLQDLKPSNIVVKSDCTLKILDFGLARIVH